MAGDGSLGTTSTATSNLSVTTTEMVQITNVADYTLNPYVPAAGIDRTDAVCVYSNDSTTPAGYTVTATGNGTANAFTITDGSHTIAYTVKWNGAGTGAGTDSLTTGVASSVYTGTNTYPCAADNASYRIQMTNSNILSVPAGTYTGTLTLQIAPNPS
jgi:hypothetical protein